MFGAKNLQLCIFRRYFAFVLVSGTDLMIRRFRRSPSDPRPPPIVASPPRLILPTSF